MISAGVPIARNPSRGQCDLQGLVWRRLSVGGVGDRRLREPSVGGRRVGNAQQKEAGRRQLAITETDNPLDIVKFGEGCS